MFSYTPRFGYILSGIILFCSCSVTKSHPATENTQATIIAPAKPQSNTTDDFLEGLLKQYPVYFDTILKNRKAWNVQVIYTQVNRTGNDVPKLQHHFFNVDPANYFYPASTVKLPIVLLALQKLNELKQKGVDKNTTMITETAFSGQSAVYNDPTASDGRPSIAQYVKKILMVSDNDAYNRLYEFLGQQYINSQLHEKGYKDVQILHRLNIFLTAEENRQTNPIKFLDSNSAMVFSSPAMRNTAIYPWRKDSLGNGYLQGNKLVRKPMNFSGKNRISLTDLHNILISLVFPGALPATQRFNITEADKQFIMKYMSQLPGESTYPPYADDTLQYWPAYGKFLLYGSERRQLPKTIRIFNKEGDAYGHLLDVAYIADFKNNIEFFLSAVVYCNSDGILNDDKYDYNNIGLPFMKHLGEVIYNYELKREQKVKPDLSPFIFKYDK